VLTLPFDIRDARFDTYQLATIPQVIGIKRSRVFGVFLLSLVVLFEFLKTPLLIGQAFILVLISLLTAFFVMRSVVKQTQYYASFWVESIPIIWCGLLILF
jgi:4-hydroxybenzoate polyprenyltransferase